MARASFFKQNPVVRDSVTFLYISTVGFFSPFQRLHHLAVRGGHVHRTLHLPRGIQPEDLPAGKEISG